MNKLIIIGASGHGKVIADIAEQKGYTDIAFLDDNKTQEICSHYPILGTSKQACQYLDRDFIIGIGNAQIRKKLTEELLRLGSNIVSLIHPKAVVASDVHLGFGTVVMAGAVINPSVTIGNGCIINTCASIDHDCIIGNYVHVSVGAHVAGTVTINDDTWIGIGAAISNNIFITKNCLIGAGAVVVKDIKKSGTYIGIPAKKID